MCKIFYFENVWLKMSFEIMKIRQPNCLTSLVAPEINLWHNY